MRAFIHNNFLIVFRYEHPEPWCIPLNDFIIRSYLHNDTAKRWSTDAVWVPNSEKYSEVVNSTVNPNTTYVYMRMILSLMMLFPTDRFYSLFALICPETPLLRMPRRLHFCRPFQEDTHLWKLRSQEIFTWKAPCFHLEKRLWLTSILPSWLGFLWHG